jgi:hypothetical protein
MCWTHGYSGVDKRSISIKVETDCGRIGGVNARDNVENIDLSIKSISKVVVDRTNTT